MPPRRDEGARRRNTYRIVTTSNVQVVMETGSIWLIIYAFLFSCIVLTVSWCCHNKAAVALRDVRAIR